MKSHTNSNTLDLISYLGVDRSIDQSSNNKTVPEKTTSKKRKNNNNNNNNNNASDLNPPKMKKPKEIAFSTTIEMPRSLKDRITEIGGYEIKIVTQKKLQETDLNKNQGRLSIPFKKLMNDFATEEEREMLREEDENQKSKNVMKVVIVDPLLRESAIGLKMWKIGGHKIYCLASEWNSFAEGNSLESGDYVQLWSFRTAVTSHLCFALVKLDISEGIFKFI